MEADRGRLRGWSRSVPGSSVSEFPPGDLRSFLEFCAGEWLSVRSHFDLADPTAERAASAGATDADDEASWHDARRGELTVAYRPPEREGEPGSLTVRPPASEAGKAAPPQELRFASGGRFERHGMSGEAPIAGSWRFWPDGSLELIQPIPLGVVRERIWFTKPNLRLRSSIEQHHDGRPARASFASEIRRVSRPPQSPAGSGS